MLQNAKVTAFTISEFLRENQQGEDGAVKFLPPSPTQIRVKKELKNKMNLKTDLNHNESTPGEIKKYEEEITGRIGSLKDYGDPFHGVAQNMVTGAEIPGNIINGLLSARENGTERVEQFIKKRLLSGEVSFYDRIQCSTTATKLKKNETEKGNIRPQRRPPSTSIIF